MLMIVPFGKYRGQCITNLLKDREYKEECKREPWLIHYPSVYKLLVFSEIPNAPKIDRTLQSLYETRTQELVPIGHIITGVSYDVGFHWAVCVSSIWKRHSYKTFVAMFDRVDVEFMSEQIKYTNACTKWEPIRLRFCHIEHDMIVPIYV
jgi:hypothetical protein